MAPTGGTRISQSSFESVKFKCCATKNSNTVFCILCNNVFHGSCLTRDVKDYIKIDDRSIICCEQVDITYKNAVYKVDKEKGIGNLKLFVKSVIEENKRLNDKLNSLTEEVLNKSSIIDMESSGALNDDVNIWKERYIFTKKENELLIDKNTLLLDQTTLLKEKINYLNNICSESEVSYAKVCEEGKVHNLNEKNKYAFPPLIVRCKENITETPETIIKEIKSSLNPILDGFTAKLSKAKNHVKILCENEKDCSKVNKLLKERTQDKYEIKKIELNNPMIKIINITNNYTQQELADIIARQNDLQHEHVLINVRYIRSMSKKGGKNNSSGRLQSEMARNRESFVAFVEVDPLTHKILMKNSRVKIGWEYCKIFEDFNLNRCFKCSSYGHSSKKCFNNTTCSKCAGNHDSSACTSNKIMCANCNRSNQSYHKSYNVEHAAYDYDKCEFFKNLEKQYRLRVNYDFTKYIESIHSG